MVSRTDLHVWATDEPRPDDAWDGLGLGPPRPRAGRRDRRPAGRIGDAEAAHLFTPRVDRLRANPAQLLEALEQAAPLRTRGARPTDSQLRQIANRY